MSPDAIYEATLIQVSRWQRETLELLQVKGTNNEGYEEPSEGSLYFAQETSRGLQEVV